MSLFLAPILAFYLFPVGFTPTFLGPNETSYGYLTLALYERRALDVDAEVQRFWPTEDLARHEGRYYSNKAPGLSLWLLAFTPLIDLATPGRLKLVELTYYGRVLGLTIPFVIFLYLFGRFLERLVRPAIAWGVVLAYALGTNAGVYATMLINHNLTAMAHFGAFYALWRGGRRAPWLAGLASGFGVILEMPTLLLFGALGILAIAAAPRDGRARAAGLFAAGALPMAALLLAYNWACFDNPFVVSYMRDDKYLLDEQGQVFAMALPNAERLFGLLASPSRGLLFHSPWVALALGGAFAVRRLSSARERSLLFAMLAAAAALTLFISSHLYWHGYATAGPRYLIAGYPYLAVAAGLALEHAGARRRSLLVAAFAATAVVAIAVNTLVVMIYPVIPWVPDGLFLNVISGFALPYLRAGLGTYTIASHLGAAMSVSQALLGGFAVLAAAGYALPLLGGARSDTRAAPVPGLAAGARAPVTPAPNPVTPSARRPSGSNATFARPVAGVLGVAAGALLFLLWLRLGVSETSQTHRWRDEIGAAWRHRTTEPPARVPMI